MKTSDVLVQGNAGAAGKGGMESMVGLECDAEGLDQGCATQSGLDLSSDVTDNESEFDATEEASAPTETLTGFPPVEVERGKKARRITLADVEAFADVLVDFAREGRFPTGLIPVNAGADYFGVAASVFAQVFSLADRRGLRDIPGPGIYLDYSAVKQPKPAMTAFIDPRGMLMVGKSIIESLSRELPDNLKFKSGESFTVSLRDEEIVLTRN